jgi:hypothetical protein
LSEEALAAAAEACLSGAAHAPRPFLHVKAFLADLRAKPGWTDNDLIEVQTRVIRRLMEEKHA